MVEEWTGSGWLKFTLKPSAFCKRGRMRRILWREMMNIMPFVERTAAEPMLDQLD